MAARGEQEATRVRHRADCLDCFVGFASSQGQRKCRGARASMAVIARHAIERGVGTNVWTVPSVRCERSNCGGQVATLPGPPFCLVSCETSDPGR
jgi:hypothetical protein